MCSAEASGRKIGFEDGAFAVPDNPIIPVIEGDGVGPEITAAALSVIDAAVKIAYSGRRSIAWKPFPAGEKLTARGKDPLPQTTIDAVAEYRIAIKGPLTTPVAGGYRSLNVTLRQVLDLYACVRPAKWIPGVPSPVKRPQDLDVVIFRENTEDVYAGIEYEARTDEAEKLRAFLVENFGAKIAPQSAIGIKPMSEAASRRIVRRAIKYAIEHGRRSVTLVHKGNIMKYTEGAFRDWGYKEAAEFGDKVVRESDLEGGGISEGKILIKDRIADSMFQQVLLRPKEYDVIVLPNLNGDYLSDACAAQIGGLGLAPGANMGDGIALFEATHGTAPKYTGRNMVNPGSIMLSGAMMLEHIGWKEAAELIAVCIEKQIESRRVTYDLERQMENAVKLGTREFAAEIAQRMEK